MSYRAKQRVVAGALVVLALWPLAHVALVRALDLNPWNWFGWAMYTTPPKRLTASVVDPDGRPLDRSRMTPAQTSRMLDAYAAFSDWYMEIPAAASLDDFASSCLQPFPEHESITIHLYGISVDRRTATVTKQEVEGSPWVYRRGGGGGDDGER